LPFPGGQLLVSTVGGSAVQVYDVRRLASARGAPCAPGAVAALAAPGAGAHVACFAAEGAAAVVGGGSRAAASWRFSGLRADGAYEQQARPPRGAPEPRSAKPKRQSRQHEKATKSKVRYGSRR
jgi:hypothetical protein